VKNKWWWAAGGVLVGFYVVPKVLARFPNIRVPGA
jgi:hypothetical protein